MLHRSARRTRTILALSASLLFSGLALPSGHILAHPASPPAAGEIEAYLQERYGLTLPSTLTKGDFIAETAGVLGIPEGTIASPFRDTTVHDAVYRPALALYEQGILTSDTVGAANPLTRGTAVYLAVKAAGLKELAYTYPQSKVDASLSRLGLGYPGDGRLTLQAAQELAAAADTGLLPAAYAADFDPGAPADRDFAAVLLGQILSVRGEYKQVLASTEDTDVYAKLLQAYRTQALIEVPALQPAVDQALKEGLITGYNLKDERYAPHFDKARALTYGHSDIAHAVQLIGLLRSEGLHAKIQLEPKTSAFLYLKEWGEPETSPDYKVVPLENGNGIAYAREYDLSFEFDTAEEKAKFNGIVSAYAKKNSEDQPGLIAGSWWQPLYYSLTELPEYKVIANNVIHGAGYYAQTFTLADQAEAFAAGIKKIQPDAAVESYTFWVDEPFYNYLLGGYK
ncbi:MULTISPECIES: hypothetical protein [Paenibacillus]|uniref:hypothetical protein n=1 Tax=Paenibacillus TaxID=44249 RepID=UPI0022B8AD1B|nr:hypothetical protein [Paenibacillus caseinilyticus]MCZ8523148.1 hypothetical protein [Paenibacillus caseinilyticus]